MRALAERKRSWESKHVNFQRSHIQGKRFTVTVATNLNNKGYLSALAGAGAQTRLRFGYSVLIPDTCVAAKQVENS